MSHPSTKAGNTAREKVWSAKLQAQRQRNNQGLGKRAGAGTHHQRQKGGEMGSGERGGGGLEGAGTRKGNRLSDQASFALWSAADRLSTAHGIPRLLGIWFGMTSWALGSLGQCSLCLTFHVVTASALVSLRTESEETRHPPGVMEL